MSPTRPCPLCDMRIAQYLCFGCGLRVCLWCLEEIEGLCPQCGGITWIDMEREGGVVFRTEEELDDEEFEDV